MNFRLWFPQLDVYDAIRRIAILLSFWTAKSPSMERLFIFDFYFANPPLLHHTHMPSTVRQEFTKLHIPRPESSFVSYPSAPVLFHKMEFVQKQAVHTLVGKGLINRGAFSQGAVELSATGMPLLREQFASLMAESEKALLGFLVEEFAKIGIDENSALRRSTGLRRMNQ